MQATISIRLLTSPKDYHTCEALQHEVWSMPDAVDVVPLHLLLSVQRNGGLVLGAFEGDELVGFVFGYPGLSTEGKVVHCSHIMGVAPDHRSKNVGYRLKAAQRQFVLEQGLDLIAWTYDPLESRNAYLNIHKLGATCRTYIQDYYGPLSDGLNVGMPTDRFPVEWWITSERVRQRLTGEQSLPSVDSALQVNITKHSAGGLLTPGPFTLDATAEEILVEIPTDYQAIKAADPSLGLEWRLATRQIFEAYFAAGYVVVDLSYQARGAGRAFYVLRAG